MLSLIASLWMALFSPAPKSVAQVQTCVWPHTCKVQVAQIQTCQWPHKCAVNG